MRYRILFLMLLSLVLFSAACAPPISKKEAFPRMYEERPLTILVLPPINVTTAADAKEYYSTSIAEPLSYAGYYILPVEVTSDILKQEGIFDTELLLNTPLHKFREFFGADAVLYTKILKWNTSYYVIGGHLTVSVDFRLKSTVSGEDLWKYNGTMVLDTSGDSGGTAGLAGLLVKVVVTAIKTASADYMPVARKANSLALITIPYGKYHPQYDQDQNSAVVQIGKMQEEPKEEPKQQP